MSASNVIVDVIRELQLPSGDQAPEVHFLSGRPQLPGEELWLAFSSEETRARLDPADPRTPTYAVMAHDLYQHKWPVYVEVSTRPAARFAITRLSAPKVVRVRELNELPSGRIEVTLQPSHADYMLSTTNRDFDLMLEALDRARRDRDYVCVVTNPRSREIIFIGSAPPSFQPFGGSGRCPDIPDRLKTEEEIIPLVTRVSIDEAQQLFLLMHEMACNGSVAGFCMPYNYPDDGCHARAHRMCEVMLHKRHVTAAKLWLYGSGKNTLCPETSNHPKCQVSWKYHVAPVVRVRGNGRQHEHWRVIDPSLFGPKQPVPTPEEWRERQRDLAAEFVFTEAALFDQFNPGEIHPCDWDPLFKRVPDAIVQYRQELRYRIEWCGKPPYC